MAKKVVRKKPKQSRSQEVLSSIFEAATQLLNDPNPKLFTTNHIAKKAGVSIGSLYQYFPNKETILDQILQQIVIMMERSFLDAIRKIPTVTYKTFVEDFVKVSFEMCLKYPILMKRTFHIEKSEETLQLIFESRRQVANELSQIIKEKFNLRNDTDLKVYLMVHSYMGIIEAYVSSSSPYSVDEIQKLYSDMIVKMLDY